MRCFEVPGTPCMLLIDQAADLAIVRRELELDASMLGQPSAHPHRAALHVTRGADAIYASGSGYTIDCPSNVILDAALWKVARAEWVEV